MRRHRKGPSNFCISMTTNRIQTAIRRLWPTGQFVAQNEPADNQKQVDLGCTCDRRDRGTGGDGLRESRNALRFPLAISYRGRKPSAKLLALSHPLRIQLLTLLQTCRAHARNVASSVEFVTCNRSPVPSIAVWKLRLIARGLYF